MEISVSRNISDSRCERIKKYLNVLIKTRPLIKTNALFGIYVTTMSSIMLLRFKTEIRSQKQFSSFIRVT